MGLSGIFFFFSSRRRHTRYWRDWSSDVCSSDLYWEKRDKTMFLRANMYDTRTDSTDAIALAVRNATQDPIVYSLKIDSTVTDRNGHKLYSVEVTNMFNSDNSVFSIFSSLKIGRAHV